mgnify:CR=1 FL=1
MCLLPRFSSNKFTIKDSFEFAKNIVEQDANLCMASLDINSLFTNVLLDETINICVNDLFKTNTSFHGLDKKQIFDMLSLTTKESIILFNERFYEQIDGVAMGSPLGPTLANSFLCHHETNWLNDCPASFKPVYYRRYVDDIFVLFRHPEHISSFCQLYEQKAQKYLIFF